MTAVYANNLTGELDGGFAAGETELTLANADGWPVLAGGDHAWLTIYDDDGNLEIVKATARPAGDRNIVIERAQGGTTARAWSDGDSVDIRVTAQLLDDLGAEEIIDITDGELPAASAATAGRLYIDRLHRAVYFTTETRIAQADATGTFSAYSATDFLGLLPGDFEATQMVAEEDGDIGKFYFSTDRHVFRSWRRTVLLGGLFDWHWSTVAAPAGVLADAESFDDETNGAYYLGFAASDSILLSRVPNAIADAARAYGVTAAGVRYIDGSDYTAATNASDVFDWHTLSVPSISGVTTDALTAAINALVAGAPEGLDTLDELAGAINDDASFHSTVTSAIAAKVTNTGISETASTESTTVAPSRRQVATELAGLRADLIDAMASRDVSGETGRRVPTLLYGTSDGATLSTSNTSLVQLTVDADPNDFEVLMIEVKVAGIPRRTYDVHREGATWPSTETSGIGALFYDTVSNTGLVNIWRAGSTRLNIRKGGSSAGWNNVDATIFRVWGFETEEDWLAVATGTDHALIPGAEVTLGGDTAGSATGTLAEATRAILGYDTTVTAVSVAHASGNVTLDVTYTTRVPAAGLRPAGLHFLGQRWLAADGAPSVVTDNVTGISTVTLQFDVPDSLASTAAEVEALRSTTAYDLHWMVPFTAMIEGARLPAAAAERTTNARAEFDATTRRWALVDAEESVEGADQTDVQVTIILWGRFASEPSAGPNATWGDSGYAGLQSHADIGTGGAWQISEEDANLQGDAANPLYMAIAQATRTSGVWAQSPEWAIVPVDLPTQYSADGVNWHAAYNSATDSWLRYRTSSGAWSRPLSLLGPQAVLHWTTLLDFTFNNTTQHAERSITPTWLNQFREMRVEALEFQDWPSYVAEGYEQVREARIGLDHVEALAHSVTPATIAAGITNNPIACRFDANEAFIGLGSDTDLSGGGVRWPYNFSFVFRGPNANQADEVLFLDRPPSWSWCRIRIGVR